MPKLLIELFDTVGMVFAVRQFQTAMPQLPAAGEASAQDTVFPLMVHADAPLYWRL